MKKRTIRKRIVDELLIIDHNDEAPILPEALADRVGPLKAQEAIVEEIKRMADWEGGPIQWESSGEAVAFTATTGDVQTDTLRAWVSLAIHDPERTTAWELTD